MTLQQPGSQPTMQHPFVPHKQTIDWFTIFRENLEIETRWLRGQYNISVHSAHKVNVRLPRASAATWGTLLDACLSHPCRSSATAFSTNKNSKSSKNSRGSNHRDSSSTGGRRSGCGSCPACSAVPSVAASPWSVASPLPQMALAPLPCDLQPCSLYPSPLSSTSTTASTASTASTSSSPHSAANGGWHQGWSASAFMDLSF